MGHKAVEPGFAIVLLRGVFAGWLIALMVWLLPFAESAAGLGHHPDYLSCRAWKFHPCNRRRCGDLYGRGHGRQTWSKVLGGYIVPTLIGNILGGVTLVAILNHPQIVAGEKGQDL